MKDERGHWYLLTGLVLGFVAGLAFAWVVQPVEYTDTSPASLHPAFKDRYRLMIAVAYAADGDLVRARARLELLEDDDLFQVLSEQAQRTLAEGSAPDEARALGLLAIALGQAVPGSGAGVTQAPGMTSPPPYPTPTVSGTPSAPTP